jgi:hypothetical protein
MPRKPAKTPSATGAQVPDDAPAPETEQLGCSAPASSRLGVWRIVSGGQTGVDRGALDAAIELGIEHGGWCPRGRIAEDGPIPLRYALRETDAVEYAARTERNVLDSDGTLLLYKGRLQRGTLLTYRLAARHARPALRVRLDLHVDVAKIQQWILDQRVGVLNVAGPRASSCPGIDGETRALLRRVFTQPLPGRLFSEPEHSRD